MNLKIREFKKAITDFANSYDLPMEVKRLVLSEILSQAEKEADKSVMLELQEREEKEKRQNE